MMDDDKYIVILNISLEINRRMQFDVYKRSPVKIQLHEVVSQYDCSLIGITQDSIRSNLSMVPKKNLKKLSHDGIKGLESYAT